MDVQAVSMIREGEGGEEERKEKGRGGRGRCYHME